MRVVFCGNPEFAVPTLEALLASRHEVVAVVTSPDKARGRGRQVTPLPVKERALAAGLPVLQPASLKDPEFLEQIRALRPDVNVVIAFRILPRELFTLPPHGSVNVHPSLLPRGRGPAPIRWTLLRGEAETGVTIIHLTEQIDGGSMLRQERTPVGPDEDYGQLHDRLARLGARLLVEVLDQISAGRPPQPIAQDEAQVTRAPKLYPADTIIEWDWPAEEILHRVRAFSPEPGALTFAGDRRFKILAAEPAQRAMDLSPGELQGEGDGLVVGTGRGSIRLKIVQAEGKRAMAVADYLRGRPALPPRLGK